MAIKLNLAKMLKSAGKALSKNSPQLLTALGIGGFFVAIGLAIEATPKAEDLITKAEDDKGDELTKVEKVKAGAKAYVKPAVTAVVSTACILGARRIDNVRHQRQCAELATAYAISQSVIKRYEDKLTEEVGEEKAQEIKRDVEKATVQSPEVQRKVSTLPKAHPDGMQPYWDPIGNNPFYCSSIIIEQVEARLKKRLYACEPYVTLDDMYGELNEAGAYPELRATSISHKFGWTPERPPEFNVDCPEYDEWGDGTPCRVLSFTRAGRPEVLN